MTDKKLTDEEIIKRLERCVHRGNRNYDTDIVLDLINRQKKAEAYKEFAEKAVIRLTDNYHSEYSHWIDDTIDNLLKEMVGEK